VSCASEKLRNFQEKSWSFENLKYNVENGIKPHTLADTGADRGSEKSKCE